MSTDEEFHEDEAIDINLAETKLQEAPKPAWNVSFPETGSDFGKYRDLQVLGEGASARVYKAIEDELKRPVALKILNPERPQWRERFLREKNILANLSIPGIPSLLEHGEIDGLSFFAMEFVDGVTLKVWDEQQNPSQTEKVQRLMELGILLARLHDSGVVHRDIKPDNVMVNSHGELRLMDFGVARTGNEEIDIFISMPGNKAGSPAYFSPEAFDDETLHESSIDAYALGVVAYNLLCGKMPHELSGKNYCQAAMKVINTEIIAANTVNETLSEHLSEAVMQLLEKDPKERATVAHFVEMLKSGSLPVASAVEPQAKGSPIFIASALIACLAVGALWTAGVFDAKPIKPIEAIVSPAEPLKIKKEALNTPVDSVKTEVAPVKKTPETKIELTPYPVGKVPEVIKLAALTEDFANIFLYEKTAPEQKAPYYKEYLKAYLRMPRANTQGALLYSLKSGYRLLIRQGSSNLVDDFTAINGDGVIYVEQSKTVQIEVHDENSGKVRKIDWNPSVKQMDFLHYK